MDSRINGTKYGSVKEKERQATLKKKVTIFALHQSAVPTPIHHPSLSPSPSLIIELTSDLIDPLLPCTALVLYCYIGSPCFDLAGFARLSPPFLDF
jgi:hypothetical protein